MPFDKDNAVEYGSKGGNNRWRDKDPATVRNRQFIVKLAQAELDALTKKAKALNLSRTELVLRAVDAYNNN